MHKQCCQGNGDRCNNPVTSEVSQSSSDEKSPCKKEAACEGRTKQLLVGRMSEINYLRQHTYPFRSRQVVSVWGIAGVGKSALVRNVYDEHRMAKRFSKYIWVDISQPFNLSDFCRSTLSDFQSEKDPIEECRQLLQNQRCLLVIDDLQSMEGWDMINTTLLSQAFNSVVVIITTEASIAYRAKISFYIKALEADAAMDLFKTQIQLKKPSSPLLRYGSEEIEELVLRCGGLPRVIVAIAGVLAEQTVTAMDTVCSLNWGFMRHLETKPEYDSLRGLFGWMNSFFRTCPDTLKPCIMYLSIFRQHEIIRRRRITRRWIAEGYARDSYEVTAHRNGEYYFSRLLYLNIIQQPQKKIGTAIPGGTNKMVLCQVNAFFGEYIISRLLEENFVFNLWGDCAPTTQRTGRHLIIHKHWDRDINVFKSTDFSRLRSLTVYGEWCSFFVSERMKFLRVLDLEDASGVRDEDLEKIFKWLRRLKFLSLRGQREIYHLPNSLGHLRQLQTLDIRHTSIVTLPESITKLQKLQYIRAGNTTNSNPAASAPPVSSSSWFCRSRRHTVGVQVPRGVGELTGLHTLGVINVGASRGKAVLEELKKLTQLRKLGMSGITRKNKEFLLSLMKGHGHLKSLSVHLDQDNKGCLNDISLPWKNLKSLKLYGLAGRLPLSSNPDQYSKLRKLNLEMDTLELSGIEFLAELPELCILRLQVKQLQDGKLHFYAEMNGEQLDTFEKVKILEIACSSNELQVTFGSKSMKNLELLTIDYSSASYHLAGMNNLSELKQVLLKGTNDEAFRAEFASHLANHPNRPVVKLEELPRSS